MSQKSEPKLCDLQKEMEKWFDLRELSMFVFEYLQFDWENLHGSTKTEKTISLIKKSITCGKYEELISALAEKRPHGDWSSVSPDDPKIEDVENEFVTTSERQQAEIFQGYVQEIEKLILHHSLGSSASENIKELARTHTLTVLQRLYATGKRDVLEFLMRQRFIDRANTIVSLADADFRGANLQHVNLKNANLAGVDLNEADLSGAILDSAVLKRANLSDANLTKASLRGARKMRVNNELVYFDVSDLSGADLSRANLEDAKVYDWQLHKAASLDGATMPGGQIYRIGNEEDSGE